MRRVFITLCMVMGLTAYVDAQNYLTLGEVVKYEVGGLLPSKMPENARLGRKMDAIGDLDGDGISELAVCAHLHLDSGTQDTGAVFIYFFNREGQVKDEIKISGNSGGFSGKLTSKFALDIAAVGDLNNDGVVDIAVSEQAADNGRGAIWILFLERNFSKGTGAFKVKTHTKIAPDGVGGFMATSKEVGWKFANAITNAGDIDGDGVNDLAVGVGRAQNLTGSVWILFLNTDGSVKGHQEISNNKGNLGYTLTAEDFFGVYTERLGDIDNDGVPDIAVGAHQTNAGGTGKGAVYVFLLNNDGTVKKSQKISTVDGGFSGSTNEKAYMGFGLCGRVDFDADGVNDLVIGAFGDEDAGFMSGAVFVCYLDVNGGVKSTEKITPLHPNYEKHFGAGDRFGTAITSLGDINGDGIPEMAIGAMTDGEGSFCLIKSPGIAVHSHQLSSSKSPWKFSLSETAIAVDGPQAWYSIQTLDCKQVRQGDVSNTISSVDITGLSSGIYLMSLQGEDNFQSLKLYIQ